MDVPLPEPAPDDRDLFTDCLTRSRGEFTLAIALTTLDLSEHERSLVDVALAAGVVGTLAAIREVDDEADPDAPPDR